MSAVDTSKHSKPPEPKKPDPPKEPKKKEEVKTQPQGGGSGAGAGVAHTFKDNTFSPSSPTRIPLDGGGAPPVTAPGLATYKVTPGAGDGLLTSTKPIDQVDLAPTAPGVPLDEQQKAELEKIYGPGLDTSQITIVTGSPELFDSLEAGGRYTPAYTMGNTIVVNPKNQPISPDLLAHEAAHAWQYQNGSGDYFAKALVGQKLGQGYDWQKGLADGRSWEQLNPEQQAQMIQDAYRAGYFDTGKLISPDGTDSTAQMDAIMNQVRAGEGTSQKWDFGW